MWHCVLTWFELQFCEHSYSSFEKALRKICKNTGKYGLGKTRILTYFTQWKSMNNTYYVMDLILFSLPNWQQTSSLIKKILSQEILTHFCLRDGLPLLGQLTITIYFLLTIGFGFIIECNRKKFTLHTYRLSTWKLSDNFSKSDVTITSQQTFFDIV